MYVCTKHYVSYSGFVSDLVMMRVPAFCSLIWFNCWIRGALQVYREWTLAERGKRQKFDGGNVTIAEIDVIYSNTWDSKFSFCPAFHISHFVTSGSMSLSTPVFLRLMYRSQQFHWRRKIRVTFALRLPTWLAFVNFLGIGGYARDTIWPLISVTLFSRRIIRRESGT